MKNGILVEIDISDIVWDECTDGTSYFPKEDFIIYQAYDFGKYHNFIKGYLNPEKNDERDKYVNYNDNTDGYNLYMQAISVLMMG